MMAALLKMPPPLPPMAVLRHMPSDQLAELLAIYHEAVVDGVESQNRLSDLVERSIAQTRKLVDLVTVLEARRG